MMRYLKQFLSLVLVCVGLVFAMPDAKASHMSGGNIDFKCLGGDTFEITTRVFRYCRGAGFSPRAIQVTATSTCGNQVVATLDSVSGPLPRGSWDITDMCKTQKSNCQNGNTDGIEMYVFRGKVVLTPKCNYWSVYYRPPCCRPTVVNTSTSTPFLQTRINNAVGVGCNRSPTFDYEFFRPTPSACIGSQVTYAISAFDPDGDSLRYAIHPGWSNLTTLNTIRNPGTQAQPIPGITIDPATGLVKFNSTGLAQGQYTVTVAIFEYERCTGVLKSTSYRELLFQLRSCSPVNRPPIDTMGITGLTVVNPEDTNKILLVNKNYLEVCNGVQFSFTDTVEDPDVNDSVFFDPKSVYDELPNSFVTTTYLSSNRLVVRVNWRATLQGGGNPIKVFAFKFFDNYCPAPGTVFSTYTLYVRNSTNAGPDQAFCEPDSTIIEASGGKMYQWKSIWGDSIKYGVNFWGDTTTTDTNKKVIVKPSKTTYYVVWSDLKVGCIVSQACTDIDTVKIVVAEDYDPWISNDTMICYNDSSINIEAGGTKPLTYTYEWSPAGSMDSSTAKRPLVTPLTDTEYKVTITSDSGCVKYDSMTVKVTPPFPVNIRPTASDTVACAGNPLNLGISFGYEPTSCGKSPVACTGIPSNGTVGSFSGAGTGNTSTTGNGPLIWPTPYGSASASSARMQFLVRSSELSAAGIGPRQLTGLSFYVNQLAGSNAFPNYSIKLKCVSKSTIGSTYETGMTEVYSPKTHVVSTGWNYHQFDTLYDWDGTSNLLVEICYSGASSSAANNSVAFETTAFNSCLSVYSVVPVCNLTNIGWASATRRPVMRFEYCGSPNKGGFDYKWIPSTYLSSDSIHNPIATIYDSIDYKVAVGDTFGKCFDTSEVLSLKLTRLDLDFADTALCPFDTIQLDADIFSRCAGTRTYKWKSPTGYISNDSIKDPWVYITQDTYFELTFEDTCGCSISDTVKIDLLDFDPPNIQRFPPNCGLDNGALQITGSGGVSPYIYSIDSMKTFDSSGVFSNLNNGYFDIVIKDAAGCYVYKKDTFTNTAPIIDSLHHTDLTCFESNDGRIEVFASQGIQPLQYSVDNGTTYQASNVFTNLPAGTYSIVVISNDGCMTTPDTVVITQPTELLGAVKKTEVTCFGACDAEVYASAQGSVPPYSFHWANSGTFGDTLLNTCGGADSVTITDAVGCTRGVSFNVVEHPEVIIDSIVETPITCFGSDNAALKVYSQGGKTARYNSINGGLNYTQNSEFKDLEPGTYAVIVRDVNGCKASDTISFIEPDLLEVFPTIDSTRICVSTCANLSATSKGGNPGQIFYNWSPGLAEGQNQTVCPDEDMIYTLYASDEKGCISSTKKIKVELFDSLSIEGPDTVLICNGDKVRLSTSASGGDGKGYTYLWSPFTRLDNPNKPDPYAYPDSTTVYSVELGDICGSPAVSKDVVVKVLPRPAVDFVSDTNVICAPGSVNFTNLTPNSASCMWHFGDGNQVEYCKTIPNIYFRSGDFDIKLVVIGENGCRDSLIKEDYIYVHPSPRPNFSMDPPTGTVLKPTITFNDLSQGDITEWNWNFGGLGTSTEQSPTYRFPEDRPGKYPVRLSVTNIHGCISDTIRNAVIGAEYLFFIPTAFTPNEDGKNEVFKPEGMGVEQDEYYMQIFDRWGQLVFESRKFTDGWDGMLPNGKHAAAGVYAYRIIIGDEQLQKERHEYSGSVTLYR